MNIFWLTLQIFASIPMIPRDVGFAMKFLKVNKQMTSWDSQGLNIHQVFDKFVEANSNKVAIHYENQAWTFRELQIYSLKIANYFKKEGFKAGDKIALLMENHPRYIGTWMGLSRIGIITALVNNQAKGLILLHAVTKATMSDQDPDPCKAIIVTSNKETLVDFASSLSMQDQDHTLPEDFKIYISGSEEMPDFPPQDKFKVVHLDAKLTNDLAVPVDETITKSINMGSKMVYIYTSGTEGFPKAAVYNFKRFVTMATGGHYFYGLKTSDTVYTPLPLYHTSGGLLGVGQMLLFGSTMVVKNKFSATDYFPDCDKYGVTVGQYIGEICSYIWARPKSPSDRKHKVRLMLGNGMRKTLWKDFQKRFNIKQIAEFYGSTEGNANLANINNKVGAVGFMPWYLTSVYPIDLIEYDPDTGKPVVKDGLCVRARKKGLLVGKIKTTTSGLSSFEGYVDKDATDSKILRNVFKKGDAYFNSGDILERDIFCNYYFVDRLGDTFRWKSENVAASQLESIISKELPLNPGLVTVYGVQVAEHGGRAGMAAFIIKDTEFKFDKFEEIAKKQFDGPRTPVFLRFTDKFPQTTTQKIQKSKLKEMGFNPAPAEMKTDTLYYFDLGEKKYKVLTEDIYNDIMSMKKKI